MVSWSGPGYLGRTGAKLSNGATAYANGTNNCSGGPGWVRTSDLPVKSRLLCQLSYGPSKDGNCGKLLGNLGPVFQTYLNSIE